MKIRLLSPFCVILAIFLFSIRSRKWCYSFSIASIAFIIYSFIYLFIYLFTYLFSNSWIRGYVPKTETQGTITSPFPRRFQVPTSSILWTKCCKLRCHLTGIVWILYSSLKTPKNNCRRMRFNFRDTTPNFLSWNSLTGAILSADTLCAWLLNPRHSTQFHKKDKLFI